MYGLPIAGLSYVRSTGSTNTAICADGSDLSFISGPLGNAVTRMVVKTDGKVGIGKDSPDATFEVFGNNDTSNPCVKFVSAPDIGSTVVDIKSNHTGGSDRGVVRVRKSGADQDLFHINNDGNVGIGITDPAEKLDVTGTIKSTGLNVQSTETTINLHTTRSNMYSYVNLKNTTSSKDSILLGYHTTGDFAISRADGSYAKLRLWHDDSRMHLMSSSTFHANGDVRIGGSPDDLPNAKLDVVGNVKASSIDLNTDIGYSAVFSKNKCTLR